MKQRDFIKGIAGSAAAWPLPALAQEQGKLPTVVYLGGAEATKGKWFGAGRTTADEHRQRLDPRRCRRRLKPDRATQGEDNHPRSSVRTRGE
jgi:hypothetical protein